MKDKGEIMMNMVYCNIFVVVDGFVEVEWVFKKVVNSVKKNNVYLIICYVIDI